jgi:hypothetical protein
LNGGPFDGGTDLLVWLEEDFPRVPVACGTSENDTCQEVDFELFDEGGGSLATTRKTIAALAFRLAVGSEALPATAPFGFFELDHFTLSGCLVTPSGSLPMQAWVMPVMRADGRFSVGVEATRVSP